MTSTTPGSLSASLASSPLWRADKESEQEEEPQSAGHRPPASLRYFGVRSGAGDQSQEELALRDGEVVAVDGLPRGVAEGGAMHDGTAHRVLVALVLRHMLKEKKTKQRCG